MARVDPLETEKLIFLNESVSISSYLKLTLENSIRFSQERENLFFGINASVYETLKSDYEDKYEYIALYIYIYISGLVGFPKRDQTT